MKTHDELVALIGPVVTALGCELWAVEYHPGQQESLLRVYIDKADGVDVDDCERVSREVAAILDVEDPIPGAYRLEISSPGLDRVLVGAGHFARYVGRQVRVELVAPIDGQRRFRGEVLDVEATGVRLHTPGGDVRLPWAQIDRARLVPDMETSRTG
ncbi:MAG: ribosome maturation factor RimP [Nevskiaceae bacterium]|nr:MAG: ribosome maturation factor RimP [Nevskiaceae bacterium]TBR73518.1 MAG: ribosome maturation factor RimP [Nevskiaceae bacterium]